jgi:hypothetical protein
MIISNPYRPDVAKLIEETISMLSKISTRYPASSSWNPDPVKGWPHRNSRTWDRQPATLPRYGAPSTSPPPKKDTQKAPCPGGAPHPPSPSTPIFRLPPRSEQPDPGPIVNRILQLVLLSILQTTSPPGAEDPHPELTAFIVFKTSEWFSSRGGTWRLYSVDRAGHY